MSNSSYLIKTQPESALLVTTSNTVQNQVGICYFDPIDETLKELNSSDGHVLTIQSYKRSIRKYYLVANPTFGNPIQVVITPIFTTVPAGIDPTNYYSLKIIASAVQPQQSNFDDLVNLNSVTVTDLTAGSLVPIWVSLSSTLPLNAILGLSFQVDYE